MMLADHLEADRERLGFTLGQAAYRLGLTVPQYRELLEGRHPITWETWDRICDLYGWPQTVRQAGLRSTPIEPMVS
jgi:plasmid maintenance system antidote protein VapI